MWTNQLKNTDDEFHFSANLRMKVYDSTKSVLRYKYFNTIFLKFIVISQDFSTFQIHLSPRKPFSLQLLTALKSFQNIISTNSLFSGLFTMSKENLKYLKWESICTDIVKVVV